MSIMLGRSLIRAVPSFSLELYVTLKDSTLLSSLQEDLIKLSPHEIDNFTRAPRIIVLPWTHQKAAFDAVESKMVPNFSDC